MAIVKPDISPACQSVIAEDGLDNEGYRGLADWPRRLISKTSAALLVAALSKNSSLMGPEKMKNKKINILCAGIY